MSRSSNFNREVHRLYEVCNLFIRRLTRDDNFLLRKISDIIHNMQQKNKQSLIVIVMIVGVALTVILFLIFTRGGNQAEEVTENNITETDTKDLHETLEAEQTVIYTIEYDVPWSTSTHPDTLPPGAHVSPIVVVSHMNENDLFTSGTEATDGIEIMAETGATKVLVGEISDNSSIFSSVIGTRLDVPDSNTLKLELDQDHSLLSAVSMLAPSPDWFVAINSVELFKDGQWLEEIELTMKPYDAGTDSGTTFTATDFDTSPAKTIGPPIDSVFVNAADENGFATITITKI